LKDLKPNWPAMTKTNKEKNLKKKQTNETVASGEKRQMQNNADIPPVSKQGVFSTKETQEEQKMLLL
jgi:hypothetical protein